METKQAKARFRILNAQEETFTEGDEEQKLTSGKFTIQYTGEINGESVLMELKNYLNKGQASIYGLEKITGGIADREGSFVLEHIGIFSNGLVVSKRTVVPLSGTGELKGLRGESNFSSEGADNFEITLDYYFE